MGRYGRLLVAALALALFLAFPVFPALSSRALEAEEQGSHPEGWAVAWRVINFAILAGALTFLLRKPLSDYLGARTEQIRQELAEAAEKRRRAAEERQRAETRLGTLDQELAQIRDRARIEADSERRRILAAAAEEAARIQAAARREIGAELERARRQLAGRATELAVELAQKKLAQSVNARDREILFEKSLERLEKVK